MGAKRLGPVLAVLVGLTLTNLPSGLSWASEPPDDSCPNGQVADPQLRDKVTPEYPKRARRYHVAASVTLEARIMKDGSVSDVKVTSCTRRGLGFEEAASDAVRQWRYKPGTCDGKPIEVWFTVRVDFEMA